MCALLGASTAVATAASAVLHNLTLDTKARQACTMAPWAGIRQCRAVQHSAAQRLCSAVQSVTEMITRARVSDVCAALPRYHEGTR